jgi:hypothetical protein
VLGAPNKDVRIVNRTEKRDLDLHGFEWLGGDSKPCSFPECSFMPSSQARFLSGLWASKDSGLSIAGRREDTAAFGAAVLPANLFPSEPLSPPAGADGTESLDRLSVWSSSPPYPTMLFLITELYYTEKGVEKQGTGGYKGS